MVDVNGQVTPSQFWDRFLWPQYQRYKRVKYNGLKIHLQEYMGPIVGEGPIYVEYMFHGKKLPQWIGVDTWEIRAAESDDPHRILEFMHLAATDGRKAYHPSCWQYLLGNVTQVAIKSGALGGFKSLLGKSSWSSDEALGAMGGIRKAFDEQLADDKDHERVARQESVAVPKLLFGANGQVVKTVEPEVFVYEANRDEQDEDPVKKIEDTP